MNLPFFHFNLNQSVKSDSEKVILFQIRIFNTPLTQDFLKIRIFHGN